MDSKPPTLRRVVAVLRGRFGLMFVWGSLFLGFLGGCFLAFSSQRRCIQAPSIGFGTKKIGAGSLHQFGMCSIFLGCM